MSEEGWEQKYVKEAFDTNWVVLMGPNINAFEKDLEEFVNQRENENALDRKVGVPFCWYCSGTLGVDCLWREGGGRGAGAELYVLRKFASYHVSGCLAGVCGL